MDTGFGSRKPDSVESPTGLTAGIFTYYQNYFNTNEMPRTLLSESARQEQRSKCTEYTVTKPEVLTCGHRGRVVAIPAMAEPVVVPVPPTAVPTQATDVEVATGAAVDRAPEKYGFAFPFIRDEVGVGHVEVTELSTVDWCFRELLTKIVTSDISLLLTGIQIERDLCGVELHLTAHPIWQLLGIRQNRPAIWHRRCFVEVDQVHRRRFVEVDQVFDHLDFGTAEKRIEDLFEEVSFTQLLDLCVVPTIAAERLSHFVCLTRRHHELVTHSNLFLSLLWTRSFNEPVRLLGSQFSFATVEKGLK
jgi:hypothetical protein